MSDIIVFAFIFAAIGAVLAVLGGGVLVNALGFRRRAERGRGEVVRLRLSRDGVSQKPRPSHVYYPTLRFTTADGRQVESESPVGSNPPAAKPGATVPVIYDRADPARVRIDTPLGTGVLGGGVAFGLGLLFLAAGVAFGVSQLAG